MLGDRGGTLDRWHAAQDLELSQLCSHLSHFNGFWSTIKIEKNVKCEFWVVAGFSGTQQFQF